MVVEETTQIAENMTLSGVQVDDLDSETRPRPRWVQSPRMLGTLGTIVVLKSLLLVFVAIVIFKRRFGLSRTALLSLSMVFYSVICGIVISPRYLDTVLTGTWHGTDLDCEIFIVFHEFVYTFLPLSIIVINVHTVLWVKDPCKYISQMTTKVFAAVVAMPWLVCALIVAVTFAIIAPGVGHVYKMGGYSVCFYDRTRRNLMTWYTFKALCHFFLPLSVNLPILIALGIIARNRLRKTSTMEDDDSATNGRNVMLNTLYAVTSLNAVYYLMVSPYYMNALCRLTGLVGRSTNEERNISRAASTFYRFAGIAFTMWWLTAFPETRSALWEVLQGACHAVDRFCCVKVKRRPGKGVDMTVTT